MQVTPQGGMPGDSQDRSLDLRGMGDTDQDDHSSIDDDHVDEDQRSILTEDLNIVAEQAYHFKLKQLTGPA